MQEELKIGNPAARAAARWATLRGMIDYALGDGWSRDEKNGGWPHWACPRGYEGWRHAATGRLVVFKLKLGEHPALVALWPDAHLDKAERMERGRRLAARWSALYIASRTVAACAPDVPASCLARELEARAAFLELVTDGGEE